ncbi:MAG: hypothetical protein PHS96_03385 [Anaerolineales bacterium]|nr:hypothetical protein [Anaerolineales bacterium]
MMTWLAAQAAGGCRIGLYQIEYIRYPRAAPAALPGKGNLLAEINDDYTAYST